MEQSIMASGPKRVLEMARASKSGKMEASTRATGRMTKPMDTVD